LFYNYECICTVSRELARADINSVIAPVPDGDNYAWAMAKVMYNLIYDKSSATAPLYVKVSREAIFAHSNITKFMSEPWKIMHLNF